MLLALGGNCAVRAQAPAAWIDQDVGSPAIAGSTSTSGDTITIVGGGAGVGGVDLHHDSMYRGDDSYDVFGYADAFHFYALPWSGDGEIVARLASLSGGDAGAQAGVMIRAGTDASAENIFCAALPAGALKVTDRVGALVVDTRFKRETQTSLAQAAGATPPLWIKLVRSNGGVLSSTSVDGVNWTERSWVTAALTADVQFGLAVSGHAAGAAATAVFDHVQARALTAPVGPPVPPSGLAVTARGADYVSLSWTASTSAFDSLTLERSTDGANFTTAPSGSAAINATAVTDGFLAPGTTYTYRLKASRGAMVSYSGAVTVQTFPIVLTATGVWSTRADLRVACDGAAENYFVVETSTDNVNFSYGAPVAATTNSYSNSALAPNTTYYFRAGCYSRWGNPAGYSNIVVVTTNSTPPAGVPAAPSDLAIVAVSDSRVALQWRDNSSDEQSFVLERKSDDGFTTELGPRADTTTYLDEEYISAPHTYTYRIRAVNANGMSAFSNAVVASVVKPVASPATPTNLTVIATASGEATLNWSDQSNNEAWFEIERSTDNVTFTYLGWVEMNVASYVDRGLTAGTNYYYRVRAVNGAGDSGYSNVASTAPAPVLAATGGPTITAQPSDQVAGAGGTASFAVAAAANSPSYLWQWNGRDLAGANGPALTLANVQPANAGLYVAQVTAGGATSSTRAAVLGIASSVKVVGDGAEVGANIIHPNGNIYDQVLLQGTAATITADRGQVTRLSYVDLSDDIVQVEFAGAGSLTLTLDNASGPAPARNYNQPDVSYMRGHASIVVVGADETTNVSVFSVGKINAVNQALFRSDVTYDGVADLASIAIQSADGKFGGLRAANASFWATRGLTGVYAPGVQFVGPVYVCDITATENATPVLLLGEGSDVRVTGGDLAQTNGRAVEVSGIAQIKFTDGITSQGDALPAKQNQARLEENGANVTTAIVANPQ